MTGQNIIDASLRQLGVIASGESPTAEESADALATMNRMIEGWNQLLRMTLAGSYASALYTFTPIATFATLATSSALLEAYNHAIIFNLAVELASEFGKEVPASVAAIAAQSRQQVLTLPAPRA